MLMPQALLSHALHPERDAPTRWWGFLQPGRVEWPAWAPATSAASFQGTVPSWLHPGCYEVLERLAVAYCLFSSSSTTAL